MIPTVTLVVKGQDIYTAPVIQGGFSDLLQLTQPRKPITTDWAEEPRLDTVQTMLQPQPTRPLKTKLWLSKGLYQSDIRYIDTIRVGYDRLYPIKIRGTYVVDSYNDESVYAISGTIQQSKTPPTTRVGRNLIVTSRWKAGYLYGAKNKNDYPVGSENYKVLVGYDTFRFDPVYIPTLGESKVTYKLYDNGGSTMGTVQIHAYDKDKQFLWWSFDNWKAIVGRTVTWTLPADTVYIRLGVTNENVRAKVEFGTVATDWTPAPEDVDESVSTLESHTTAPKEYTLGPEHIALATFGASPLEGWQSALQDKTTYKETSPEASRDVVLPILLQGDTTAQLLTARDTLDALLYRRTRNQLTTPYGTYSFFFTRSRVREYSITDKPYIIYDLTLTLV